MDCQDDHLSECLSHSHFELHLNKTIYTVHELQATESVSQLFYFTIVIHTKFSFPTQRELLLNPAQLRYFIHGKLQREIIGIITSVGNQGPALDNQYHYCLRLAPRLSLLKWIEGPATHSAQNIQEMVNKCLLKVGYNLKEVDWQLTKPLSPKQIWIQAPNESLLQFILRHLSQQNISFYFDDNNATQKIKFFDDFNTIPNSLKQTQPAYHFADFAVHHSRKTLILFAYGQYPSLSPGQYIVINTEEFHGKYSGRYFVKAIHHQMKNTFGSDERKENHYFEQCIQLVPSDADYSLRKRSHPTMPQVMTASIVCDPNANDTCIDHEGKYWTQFHFDHYSENNNFQNTTALEIPLAALTPHASRLSIDGHKSGWHTHLSPGTDVIIGFMAEDPNRPIIIGSAPSVMRVSPVTNTNPTHYVWKSERGSCLTFDEYEDFKYLTLHTPAYLQALTFKQTSNHNYTLLQNQQGGVSLSAYKKIEMTAQNILESYQNYNFKSGKNYEVTAGTTVHVESGADLSFVANDALQVAANHEINLQGNNSIILNSDDTLNIHVQAGEINLKALLSDLKIRAGKNINIKVDAGELLIGTRAAGLHIDQTGGVCLFGNVISLTGSAGIFPNGKINHLPGPGPRLIPTIPSIIQPPRKLPARNRQKNEGGILQYLLFNTVQRSFYLLTATEYHAFKSAHEPWDQLIKNLYAANAIEDDHRDDAVVKVKQELNVALNRLGSGINASDNLVEIIDFKSRAYRYIPKEDVEPNWITYSLGTGPQFHKEIQKIINVNGLFNVDALSELVSTQAEAKVNSFTTSHVKIELFDKPILKDLEGSVNDWARSINQRGTFKTVFHGESCEDLYLEIAAAAHVLRYVAGSSIAGSYDPVMGKLSFSADAKATFEVARARVSTQLILPNQTGWHLQFDSLRPPHERPDLGCLQVVTQMGLTGFTGASVLAEIQLNFSIQKNSGRILVNGMNKVAGEVGFFAGVKAGCNVSATLQWQKPGATTWVPLANIGINGDVALGIGGELDFEIRYDGASGKFIIYFKAGVVFGPGFSGGIGAVVYFEYVEHFVMFCYFLLLENNFTFLDIISAKAFKTLINLMGHYLVFQDSLAELSKHSLQNINEWWNDFNHRFTDDNYVLQYVSLIACNILQNPDKLKYTPPEAKGRFLYLLTDERIQVAFSQDPWLRKNKWQAAELYWIRKNGGMLSVIEDAVLQIVSYVQSKADYQNVLQHMTLEGEKVDIEESEKRVSASLHGSNRDEFLRLRREKLGVKRM